MATAFAERERERRGLDGAVAITTGGTHPADRVHEGVVDAMDEAGVDLSDRVPGEVTTAELESCDVVVTMAVRRSISTPTRSTFATGRSTIPGVRTAAASVRFATISRHESTPCSTSWKRRRSPMADSEEPEANDDLDAATQRQVIRERYAGIAAESDTDEGSCCSSDECCDGGTAATTATPRATNAVLLSAKVCLIGAFSGSRPRCWPRLARDVSTPAGG
jgi:protein-tyrosine-phosphatase